MKKDAVFMDAPLPPGARKDTKESLIGYVKNTSRLVMARDLNFANSLFGGLLVQWVDEAASIFVMSILKTRNIVTKKISEVIYSEPTKMGDVLEFLFKVEKVGRTSIQVRCHVVAKAIDADDVLRHILECDLVFVKVDKLGRPQPHGHNLD